MPFKLTDEQEKMAISMANEGKSLTQIVDELLITAQQFWKYRKDALLFEETFSDARQNGLETLADELITMANDTTIDSHRVRIKSDNYKWLLSKRKSRTYGDKLDIQIAQTVDIRGALEEAKSRIVLPITGAGVLGTNEAHGTNEADIDIDEADILEMGQAKNSLTDADGESDD